MRPVDAFSLFWPCLQAFSRRLQLYACLCACQRGCRSHLSSGSHLSISIGEFFGFPRVLRFSGALSAPASIETPWTSLRAPDASVSKPHVDLQVGVHIACESAGYEIYYVSSNMPSLVPEVK